MFTYHGCGQVSHSSVHFVYSYEYWLCVLCCYLAKSPVGSGSVGNATRLLTFRGLAPVRSWGCWTRGSTCSELGMEKLEAELLWGDLKQVPCYNLTERSTPAPGRVTLSIKLSRLMFLWEWLEMVGVRSLAMPKESVHIYTCSLI